MAFYDYARDLFVYCFFLFCNFMIIQINTICLSEIDTIVIIIDK